MCNLDCITNETEFLLPYYKQFIRHLKGDIVLLLGDINDKCLCELEKSKIKISQNDDVIVNGIVIHNALTSNNIEEIPKIIKDRLGNGGIVLIINNNNYFEIEEIKYHFKSDFDILEEFIGDEKWNFILYSKKTTK